MKKLVTIALLCAMLLSCFAGCAMQKGEIDADAFAVEGVIANVNTTGEYDETKWVKKTALDADADSTWTGRQTGDLNGDGDSKDAGETYIDADVSWYTGDKDVYEISTAAQLRGIIKIMDAQSTGGIAFEGVTIKLTNDINLNKKTWYSGHSQKYFGGTFDGQGHAIGNFKMEVTGAAYQSFFGGIAGNACIKNLSFVDATFQNKLNPSDKKTRSDFAVVSSRANLVEGKTVSVYNIYADVDFVVTDSAKYACHSVGSLVSTIQGNGTFEMKNCENASTIVSNGNRAAGIVSYITAGGSVTLENCKMTGSIDAPGTEVGGIVGYVYSINDKLETLTIKDCVVTGTIETDGGNSAGLIGRLGYYAKKDGVVTTSQLGTVSISGCQINATVTGGGNYIGGYIGYVNAAFPTLKIESCTVNGTVSGQKNSGAVIGYIDQTVASLSIKNMVVDGSFSANRSSSGVIGYLNSGDTVLENVAVHAKLEFNLSDSKNQNAGGLVGRIDKCENLTINNCVVDGSMTVNYNSSATAEDGVATTYAGGLIGYFKPTSGVITISDSYFGTADKAAVVTLTKTNAAVDAYWGVYVGGAGKSVNAETGVVSKSTFIYSNVFQNVNSTAASAVVTDVAGPNAKDGLNTSLVGYQTKENDDGTYSLRYVFGMEDGLFTAAGVEATIRSIKNGELTEKVQTVYVKKVYNSVNDKEGNIYAATDYNYDYLYTLVIEGIPAEYTFDAENLQVVLTSFGSNMVEGEEVVELGVLFARGADLAVK